MMIDSQLFRAALAQWASGVTIVTAVRNEKRVGITASSFSSVSLEPPRVLICIAKHLQTHKIIEESQAFGVNILSEAQQEWGMCFAGKVPENQDRFAGIDVFTATTGSPLLPKVLAWLDCQVSAGFDGGDHTIFLGEVVAAGVDGGVDPILYHNRHWRRLATME